MLSVDDKFAGFHRSFLINYVRHLTEIIVIKTIFVHRKQRTQVKWEFEVMFNDKVCRQITKWTDKL